MHRISPLCGRAQFENSLIPLSENSLVMLYVLFRSENSLIAKSECCFAHSAPRAAHESQLSLAAQPPATADVSPEEIRLLAAQQTLRELLRVNELWCWQRIMRCVCSINAKSDTRHGSINMESETRHGVGDVSHRVADGRAHTGERCQPCVRAIHN
jgi:hypothetical protein